MVVKLRCCRSGRLSVPTMTAGRETKKEHEEELS